MYLYSFSILNARWGWVVNATPRPLFSRGKSPVPIEYEGWNFNSGNYLFTTDTK